MAEDSYDSLFGSTYKIPMRKRIILYYSVCIPTRISLILIYYFLSESIVLTYLATIAAFFALFLFVKKQRMLDTSQTPPWYRGIVRMTLRFLFLILVLIFGISGIVLEDFHESSNLMISYFMSVYLFVGAVDYIFIIHG